MNKLSIITALSRAFGDTPYREPDAHFHASSYEHSPEVCYDGACERPRLKA
jgi:hypothetical protein